jgi:Reverse transcriptase (RNA-dependent DNA polymerase)
LKVKEFGNIFSLSSMPHGLVGNRLDYTEKDEGTYSSRTVPKGFIQLSVKCFTDSNALVITYQAFRLALIIKLLRSGQFHIETAFLYSDYDEENYMRLSDGYDKYMVEVQIVAIYPSTHVLLWKKNIFGLFQATRQWWKKFQEDMATCDYYPSKSHPSLFFNKAEDGEPISLVIIYIDDDGNIGTPDAIEEVIDYLGKVFKVKTMGKMEKFVVVISLTQ